MIRHLLRLAPVATCALVLSACSGGSEAEPRTQAGSAGSPTPSASPSPAGPQPLLPDLTTLPASSIQLDEEDPRLLRFGTTLANVGDGPLVTVPDAATPCPEGERSFRQRVSIDADEDGTYAPTVDTATTQHGGACALFHPTHTHWHIDGSARYVLRDGAGEVVAQSRKVSFCLRDTDRVPGAEAPTDATYGRCARDRLQGISAGWGDLYDYDLDGQTLRLPEETPDGTYCLEMTADPLDYFLEQREDNNASATPVVLAGGTARGAAGACPGT